MRLQAGRMPMTSSYKKHLWSKGCKSKRTQESSACGLIDCPAGILHCPRGQKPTIQRLLTLATLGLGNASLVATNVKIVTVLVACVAIKPVWDALQARGCAFEFPQAKRWYRQAPIFGPSSMSHTKYWPLL